MDIFDILFYGLMLVCSGFLMFWLRKFMPKIIADLIVLTLLYISLSFVMPRNTFLEEGFSGYLIAVGVVWLIVSFLSLPIDTWSYSFTCAFLAIIMMFAGGLMRVHEKEYLASFSQDEMGNCPEAVWETTLWWGNWDTGYNSKNVSPFKGSSKQADEYLEQKFQNIKRVWTGTIVEYERSKELTSIPKERGKKFNYPKKYWK